MEPCAVHLLGLPRRSNQIPLPTRLSCATTMPPPVCLPLSHPLPRRNTWPATGLETAQGRHTPTPLFLMVCPVFPVRRGASWPRASWVCGVCPPLQGGPLIFRGVKPAPLTNPKPLTHTHPNPSGTIERQTTRVAG
jgi:hypothetical protein